MGPLLTTWVLVAAVGAPPPWAAPEAAVVESTIAAHRSDDVASRLRALSTLFVGAPYVLSPLGEGKGATHDADPRLRLDAFDCTTFVETTLALVRAPSLDAVGRVLDRLRYRGIPAYETRRHLPEASWLPDLVAAGELEDVTVQVGGDRAVTSTFTLTHARWKKRRIARTLELPLDAVPEGEFALPWIPIDALTTLDIPPGTVLSLVREDVPWSPTRVTHQGIILADPKTGALFMRHASPVAKRVVDEPLARLVRRYLHPRVERKWKPVGINLMRVRD